jgi:hypothetical protein
MLFKDSLLREVEDLLMTSINARRTERPASREVEDLLMTSVSSRRIERPKSTNLDYDSNPSPPSFGTGCPKAII